MATANQIAADNPQLQERIRAARKLLHRRALVGAAAGAVPVPGLDWAVDAALLSRLIPAINAQFGLTPEQIARLPPRQRDRIQKAVGTVGSMLVGKLVTRDLVIRFAQQVGMRLTVRQASRYVPLAGQALSAVIGYTALRYLGEQHIRDCVLVCESAGLLLPGAATETALVIELESP